VDDRDPLDLLELDFDGELVGVRIVGARCAGFAFARARLVDVELVRCDLAGCDFSEANFERVRLVDCRCIGIELGNATWRTVTAADCRLDDANFRLTKLTQVRFEGSVCARADFAGAQFEGVAFPDCDLAGADVSKVKCKNVDLRRARLDGLKGVGSLRGATIGIEQLFGLAPGLATAVGLRVVADDDPA
jgi:uncharacterized protein YjbI with pentapeptide repeats